jgi:hypothetical protein
MTRRDQYRHDDRKRKEKERNGEGVKIEFRGRLKRKKEWKESVEGWRTWKGKGKLEEKEIFSNVKVEFIYICLELEYIL